MKITLKIFLTGIILYCFWSCTDEKTTKNEVLVLGTIHSSHLTKAAYSIEKLTKLIQEIKPDIIPTRSFCRSHERF